MCHVLCAVYDAVQRSCIDKAFLFDVATKIYVATDSSPVDMQHYELCCDMIDAVLDVSAIYSPPALDACTASCATPSLPSMPSAHALAHVTPAYAPHSPPAVSTRPWTPSPAHPLHWASHTSPVKGPLVPYR